jgi:hypothetical protein
MSRATVRRADRARSRALAAFAVTGVLASSCGGDVGGDVAVSRTEDAALPDTGIALREAEATVDTSDVWPCPPSQWGLCPVVGYLRCSPRGDGWELPETPCGCDKSRPVVPTDCKAGEAFVCRKATATADGSPTPSATPFECRCVPAARDCSGCTSLEPSTTNLSCMVEMRADGGTNIWCGCEMHG